MVGRTLKGARVVGGALRVVGWWAGLSGGVGWWAGLSGARMVGGALKGG